MNHPTVSVNGVSVRVDDEGRYNLNDLHAAAVAEGKATESQRPSNFIKSGQIKKFAQELTKATKIASVKIIKGGAQPGIWGLELVAIRYAAWLSVEFEIKVYQTFQMMIRNGISAMSRLNKIEHIINSETKAISQYASQMAKWGVGGRKQLLHSVRERAAEEVQMYLHGFN